MRVNISYINNLGIPVCTYWGLHFELSCSNMVKISYWSIGPNYTFLLMQTPFLPASQCVIIMYTKLYSTFNNINGGERNDLHVLHTNCDVPPTKRQWSRGADLLTLIEYHINKHLTGVQAQVTGHRWCESTNTQCVFPGTHSLYIVTLTVILIATNYDLLHQIALLRTFCPKGITTKQLKWLCVWQFSNCGQCTGLQKKNQKKNKQTKNYSLLKCFPHV